MDNLLMDDKMQNLPCYSFEKHYRLLSSKDFQQVFNHGHFKIHQDSFMWFVRVNQGFNNETKVSRLGLAITKKKVKRAHERNRIKRLVREYFRHAHFELIDNVDIVLTIKQSPETLSNADFVAQLQASFRLMNNKLKQHQLKQASEVISSS